MAAYKIYIDGGVGTTGLQIYQRMESQPDIEVITLPEDVRKSLPHRLDAVKQADATMLCLPDDAAKEIAAAAPADAKICDASTAHRTAPGWVYGFAELGGRRQQIKTSARVANPGCHASGFLALVAPLVQQGILAPTEQLCCTSVTGYSGGGKKMIAEYEDPNRDAKYASPRQYGLGLNHKHLPEMAAIAGLSAPPLFSPIVADYYSGMLVTVALPAARLANKAATTDKLRCFYRDYYNNEALIHVMEESGAPADGTLAAGAMSGRDDLEIFILGSQTQILLAARFDNLGKGAAGSAVQCLNLMLGREETAGLRL